MKKNNVPRIDRPILWPRKSDGYGIRSYCTVIFGVLLTMIMFCQAFSATAQTTYYVNASSAPGGNGLSWATAFTNLHDPLFIAVAGDQVWVAAGIYRPTTNPENRDISFRLKNGVGVYGGFIGNETALDQRNWTANLTILSGDIEGDDQIDASGIITNPELQIVGDNSFTVVTIEGTIQNPMLNTTILDGFTITGGLSNEVPTGGTADETAVARTASGGGIYSTFGSPTLRNLDIVGNRVFRRGAGIYHNVGNPLISHVKVRNNLASDGVLSTEHGFGGGIFLQALPTTTTHAQLHNVEIINNTAKYGGGVHGWDHIVATLTNVLIAGNKAVHTNAGAGGGIRSGACTFNLINVTMSGNEAFRGGGMSNERRGSSPEMPSRPVVKNSIIWGNQSVDNDNDVYNAPAHSSTPTVTHGINVGNSSSNNNLIGGVNHGNSNIAVIPPTLITEEIFVNPAIGNYRLSQTSPANNMGDNAAYPSAVGLLDLDGNPRIYNGGIIDLGAYEYQGVAIPVEIPIIVYVNKNVSGGDGSGSSWQNAFSELSTALNWANTNWNPATAPLHIWVAGGIYKPTINTTDRNATFELKNRMSIYGGFAGGEEIITARDLITNPTILSGDIDNNDESEIITDPNLQINGGNSYNVVVASGTNNTGVLDGFIVTGGSADANTGGFTSRQQSGAGVYNSAGSPLLRNLDITGNRATLRGGGLHNFSGAQPVLTNVRIRNNRVTDPNDGFGGGVYSADVNTHLTLINSEIDNNTAAQGGGIHGTARTFNHLINVVVSDNTASHTNSHGGGIRSEGSTFELYNVTIGGNMATSGAGISNQSQTISGVTYHSQPLVTNSIIWGNGTVGGANNIFNANANNGINVGNSNSSHNLIEGLNHGGSNITDIPVGLIAADIYRNPVNGDYRPKAGTPTWNAGSNDLYPDLDISSIDFEGNPRVYDLDNGGVIDLGAYEFQGVPMGPSSRNILYVNKNVNGGNAIGNNWTNAIPELSTALNWAATNWNPTIDGALQIWVAQGIYTPVQPTNPASVTVAERQVSFRMLSGVEVYGGFSGAETALSQRDWDNNLTIMSGDLGGDDDTENGIITDPATQVQGNNNTFQLVIGSGVDNTAILDGLVITGAHSQGNTGNRVGGGINISAGSPILRNLDIVGNDIRYRGAGIAVTSGSDADAPHIRSHVIISNSKIRHNRNNAASQGYGGGVFLQHRHTLAEFIDVEISNNSCLGAGAGGGMWVYGGAKYTINRGVIRNNSLVTGSGAGIYNQEINPEEGGEAILTNVLIANNYITGTSGNRRGAGIYNIRSSPVLTNVIITGNEVVSVPAANGNALGNWAGNNIASAPILINTIVWGNGSDPSRSIINNGAGAGVSLESSTNLIEGTEHAGTNVPGITIGMTVDDIFLDPANGDYRLLTGAPGINTGSNAKLWETIQLRDRHSNPMPAPQDPAWGTDLGGGSRIREGIVDVGVHEWTQPSTPTMRLFWNGNPVLDNKLQLSYGDQGELTITSEGDGIPTISSDPALLSLSATQSPSQAVALAIGTGQIALFSPATDNFDETTQYFDLVISPRELIVTADDMTKEFGSPDPVLTYTVEGLAFDEQATDVLAGELIREPGEEKTAYVVAQGTLAIATGNINYTLTFVEGEFTITGYLQQITLTSPYEEVEMIVGRVPLRAYSSSGLPVTLSVDDASVVMLNATDLILLRPGTVKIRATQGGDADYHPADPVEITLLVLENFVHVRTGVSPDGDGINDYFHIERIENFPENVVTIFDRTGKVIEQISGYDNNQRVFTGESLRSGTYYYRMNITVHGERRSYKGSFELKSRD